MNVVRVALVVVAILGTATNVQGATCNLVPGDANGSEYRVSSEFTAEQCLGKCRSDGANAMTVKANVSFGNGSTGSCYCEVGATRLGSGSSSWKNCFIQGVHSIGGTCYGFTGYENTCSEPEWAGDDCMFRVKTNGGTCREWCDEQESTCVKAMDNSGKCGRNESGHSRKSTANGGCDQDWNDQICLCSARQDPTEAPSKMPTISPTRDCCQDLTAECLACNLRVSVSEYCMVSPSTVGCVVESPTEVVESLTEVSNDLECREGQKGSSAPDIATSWDNSRETCAQKCREKSHCSGFDWTRNEISEACRLVYHGFGSARNYGGNDNREFCELRRADARYKCLSDIHDACCAIMLRTGMTPYGSWNGAAQTDRDRWESYGPNVCNELVGGSSKNKCGCYEEDEWIVRIGKRCGGTTIQTWPDGASSNYGVETDIHFCKSTCWRQETCTGFTFRASDSICGYYKAGASDATTRTASGHSCYLKKAQAEWTHLKGFWKDLGMFNSASDFEIEVAMQTSTGREVTQEDWSSFTLSSSVNVGIEISGISAGAEITATGETKSGVITSVEQVLSQGRTVKVGAPCNVQSMISDQTLELTKRWQWVVEANDGTTIQTNNYLCVDAAFEPLCPPNDCDTRKSQQCLICKSGDCCPYHEYADCAACSLDMSLDSFCTKFPTYDGCAGSGHHDVERFEVIDGNCRASGSCVTTPNYPNEYGNNDYCVVEVKIGGTMDVDEFDLEDYDFLKIDSDVWVPNEGEQRAIPTNTHIEFTSNGGVTRKGFKLCIRG